MVSQSRQPIVSSAAGTHTQREQKLRQTCDNCSQSKVKCDQAKPICQRCKTKGIVCHYSPSQRMGRHPRRHKSEMSWNSEGTSSCDDETAPSVGVSYHTSAEIDHNQTAGFDFNALTQTDDVSSSSTQDELALGVDSWMLAGISGDVDGYNFNLMTSESQEPLPTNAPPAAYSSGVCTAGQTSMESSPESAAPRILSGCNHFNGFSCEFVVYQMLQSLSTVSNYATSGSAHPYASNHMNTDRWSSVIGETLTVNKIALAQLNDLLTCSCFCTHRTFLLMTFCLDKIVKRYEDVLNGEQARTCLFGQTPTSHRSSVDSSCVTSETSGIIPGLVLGSYVMDADDLRCFLTQAACSGLRKTSSFIDDFTRTCRMEASLFSRGDARGAEAINTGILHAASIFLRQRIEEAGKRVSQIKRPTIADDVDYW